MTVLGIAKGNRMQRHANICKHMQTHANSGKQWSMELSGLFELPGSVSLSFHATFGGPTRHGLFAHRGFGVAPTLSQVTVRMDATKCWRTIKKPIGPRRTPIEYVIETDSKATLWGVQDIQLHALYILESMNFRKLTWQILTGSLECFDRSDFRNE